MVEGRHIATVMRTPGHEEALAVGFCIGHGILADSSDLKKILWDPEKSPGTIDLLVSEKSESSVFWEVTNKNYKNNISKYEEN